ncbi:MAG: signal peptidase II [Coprobacillus sp.]|nr:signal peptidase II [Coprobacillus sp.]
MPKKEKTKEVDIKVNPEVTDAPKEETPKEKKSAKQIAFACFVSFVWLFILLLVIDIVSKTLVKNNVAYHDSIVLIDGFLSITYTVNDGMAWGIDTNNDLANQIIFSSISIIAAIIIIVVYCVRYKHFNKYVKATLMVILAGCIGNMIDRLFYSAEYLNASTRGVVDFIDFYIFGYNFPIFNVADSCLVIGVIMLIVWLFVDEYKTNKREKAEKEAKKKAKEEAMMKSAQGELSESPSESDGNENNVDVPKELRPNNDEGSPNETPTN